MALVASASGELPGHDSLDSPIYQYYFPTATVSSYHKPDVLKQYKFIALEVRNLYGSHWAKITELTGLHFFWMFHGRLFSLIFSTFYSPPAFLDGKSIPPSCKLLTQGRVLFTLPPSSTFRAPCDYFGPNL